MTTRVILSFVVVSLLCFSCKEESELKKSQLLVNSNLEEGNTLPDGWVYNLHDGSGLAFNWTDQASSSASRSLWINKTSEEVDVWGYWTQLYEGEIPYGKDLELSVNVKAENLQGQGVSIAIRADRTGQPNNSQFVTTQGNTAITGTFNWTTYKVRLDDLDDDVSQIYVFLIYTSATTGEVYFDDATLVVQ